MALETASADPPKLIQIPSSDGRPVNAALYVPDDLPSGRVPAIITIHGGEGGMEPERLIQGVGPNTQAGTYKMLSSGKYIVLNIDYRPDAIFGLEEDDVVAGAKYLLSHERVDPKRIAIFGGSHGGHLALRLAQRMGADIACSVIGSPFAINPLQLFFGDETKPPISDMSKAVQERIQFLRTSLIPLMPQSMGVPASQVKVRLAERSIYEHAALIKGPVLFHISWGDQNVSPLLVQPTIDRMKANGQDVEVNVGRVGPHGFYNGVNARGGADDPARAEREQSTRLTQAFLERCLAPN